MYVVVTIADNGVVHAYGAKNNTPFETKAKARAEVRRMKAHDERMYPGADEVRYCVRKILGEDIEEPKA